MPYRAHPIYGAKQPRITRAVGTFCTCPIAPCEEKNPDISYRALPRGENWLIGDPDTVGVVLSASSLENAQPGRV